MPSEGNSWAICCRYQPPSIRYKPSGSPASGHHARVNVSAGGDKRLSLGADKSEPHACNPFAINNFNSGTLFAHRSSPIPPSNIRGNPMALRAHQKVSVARRALNHALSHPLADRGFTTAVARLTADLHAAELADSRSDRLELSRIANACSAAVSVLDSVMRRRTGVNSTAYAEWRRARSQRAQDGIGPRNPLRSGPHTGRHVG